MKYNCVSCGKSMDSEGNFIQKQKAKDDGKIKMTEEEVEAIIKLASELTDLLQPYVDAFLEAREAIANFLVEVQKKCRPTDD